MLSEIVNDMLFMFYAPTERFTSKKLLDYNIRLQRWHKVVSACTIYLIKLPSPSAGPNLAQSIKDLKEMSINHPLTIRMLRIVLSLSKRWELDLPLEVQRAVGSLSPETVFPAFVGNHPFFQDPRDGHADVLPVRHIPSQLRDFATHAMNPTSNISQGLAFNTSELFWPHFPDQGVPLQASHDHEPMEITAMLDGRFNEWEQHQREGFKMASSTDPLMRQSNLYDDWAQA
ncbi:MAG: hypothetical protein LQ347_005276 [Umbilicaria vellea]|nr:MAG: hypothetical protein LQ347_005276 [Umbilicaria vellea]